MATKEAGCVEAPSPDSQKPKVSTRKKKMVVLVMIPRRIKMTIRDDVDEVLMTTMIV